MLNILSPRLARPGVFSFLRVSDPQDLRQGLAYNRRRRRRAFGTGKPLMEK